MYLSVGKLVDSLFGSVLFIVMASLLPRSYYPEIPVSQVWIQMLMMWVGVFLKLSEHHPVVAEADQLLFDEIPHVNLAWVYLTLPICNHQCSTTC